MMPNTEDASLMDHLAGIDTLWPFPLEHGEALSLLGGGSFTGTDLVQVTVPTGTGLGARAILPGGYAFTSKSDGDFVAGRLAGPPGRLAIWLIDTRHRTLVAALVEEEWSDYAADYGMLFVAIVSSASAAGLDQVDLLLRLDRPNAVAATGHAFGAELVRLLSASAWSPGVALR